MEVRALTQCNDKTVEEKLISLIYIKTIIHFNPTWGNNNYINDEDVAVSLAHHIAVPESIEGPLPKHNAITKQWKNLWELQIIISWNHTLMANALSKLSMALSGSPKFNCALPRVTHAWTYPVCEKQFTLIKMLIVPRIITRKKF